MLQGTARIWRTNVACKPAHTHERVFVVTVDIFAFPVRVMKLRRNEMTDRQGLETAMLVVDGSRNISFVSEMHFWIILFNFWLVHD